MRRRFERLGELKAKLSCDWPAIDKAIDASEREISELEDLLLPKNGRSLEENARLVLFGSIARGEFTSRSDLDWVLLINGEVDVQHSRLPEHTKNLARSREDRTRRNRDIRWTDIQP